MTTVQAGQRIEIADDAELVIRLGGRDCQRVAIMAVPERGNPVALDNFGTTGWRLASASQHGDRFEIVAYIIDDRQGGFVNQAYPCTVMISGQTYHFPEPTEQLAALIIAEIYVKNGHRRLRVSIEGHTFGVDAYARARDLGDVAIPHRNRRQSPPSGPAPDRDQRPRPPAGMPLASGSGVIIGPDLVVTNAHVIEDGETFHLSRTRESLSPLAVDPHHDLALLQGRVSGNPLPIRLNTPVWLGEAVMAAGYPLMEVLGGDLKVTTGNISGLTGGMGDVSRFQFTAPIGSGSSGGAIIDEAGNLIGITSASLAHQNMRDRGSISENVNFGVKASLVFEMVAAAGRQLPQTAIQSDTDRREVTNRLRDSVVSIMVSC